MLRVSKQMRSVRTGLVMAAVALSLCACGGKPDADKDKADQAPVPVTVVAVNQRSVDITATALGTVAAQNTVTVSPQVGGQLLSLHFTEGGKVKQGQVLARIDARTNQASVAEAEAAMRRDQAALATARALGVGENGRYMTALTFGNVHGVYKPGNVKLRPEILKQIQDAVGERYGKEKPLSLVFHGGSGSLLSEIREALDYGVVKMNIDTDTQYAYTRPVADHMFRYYDGVLKVDGEVGNKKQYDPRVWGASAEKGMSARVVEAAQSLGSAGKHL